MKPSLVLFLAIFALVNCHVTYGKPTWDGTKYYQDGAIWGKTNEQLSGPDFQCTKLSTKRSFYEYTDDIMFLDRQNISCGTQGAIKAYRMLFYYHDTEINFDIICCKGGWLDMSNILNTTTKEVVSGNPSKLKDLDIKCPETHQALIGFKVIRPSNSLAAHQYQCAKANVGTSTTYTTEADRVSSVFGETKLEITKLYYTTPWCNTDNSIMTGVGWDVLVSGSTSGTYVQPSYRWGQTYSCASVNFAPLTSVTGWNRLAVGEKHVKIDAMTKKLRVTTNPNNATSFYATPVLYDCGSSRPCSGFTLRHWMQNAQGGATAHELALSTDPTSTTAATNFLTIESVPSSQIDKKSVVLTYDHDSASLNFVAYAGKSNGQDYKKNNAEYAVAANANSDIGAVVRPSTERFNFRSYVTKDSGPPVVHSNFGNVCSKSTKHFEWNQTDCPFYNVQGVGGVFSTPTVHLKTNVSMMDSAQSITFYHDDLYFRGARIDYAEGFPAYAPSDFSTSGLKSVKCSLGPNEYVVELKAVSNSSSDYQQIKAMRWKTNAGNHCVVPGRYQPTDGVFQNAVDIDVGSGIPYGMVISEQPTTRLITSVGLMFYDIIAEMNNDIEWDLETARNSLSVTKQIDASNDCNTQFVASGKCDLRFTYTKTNAQTVQNALTSSSQYAKQIASKINYKQAIKVGAKFKTGLLIADSELNTDITLERGSEQSDQETWTDTKQQAKTDAVTNTTQVGIQFDHMITSKGQNCTIEGVLYTGTFNVPWTGKYTIALKSGAKFFFPASGTMTSTISADATFTSVCTALPPPPPSPPSPPPPFQPPPPPLPSPSPSPKVPTPKIRPSPSPKVKNPSPSPVSKLPSPSPLSKVPTPTPSPVPTTTPSPVPTTTPSPVPTTTPSPTPKVG